MPRENWPFSLFFHETPFRLVRNIAENVLLFFEKIIAEKLLKNLLLFKNSQLYSAIIFFPFVKTTLPEKLQKLLMSVKMMKSNFTEKLRN